MSQNTQILNSPNLGGKNLGGGITGISPKQSYQNYKGTSQVLSRKIVVKAWNTAYATGTVNGKTRVTTPFRAVNNSGDFLGRVHYSCGVRILLMPIVLDGNHVFVICLIIAIILGFPHLLRMFDLSPILLIM